MPTYDYVCDGCGRSLEIFQSIKEAAKRKCPSCGQLKLRRLIGSGAGIIFKGSGFYETDYRSESYKKGADDEKKAKEDKGSDAKDSSSKASGEAKKGKKKKD